MKVKKDPEAFKIRPRRDAIDWGSKSGERFVLWNKLKSGEVVDLPKRVGEQLTGIIPVGSSTKEETEPVTPAEPLEDVPSEDDNKSAE